MLKVFVDHVWHSSSRRTRNRLFHYLGAAERPDFVYCNQGNERYLLHATDGVIGRELFISGEFDLDKVQAALDVVARHTDIQELETFVDVGANIGTTCLPMLARGFARRAIAIEPDPMNCRLLRINALLNEVENALTLHECAVGEALDGKLVLERSPDNWGDHRVHVSDADGAFGEASRRLIEVSSTQLDSLVEHDGSSMLLWMDTQGYEGHVLRGATALLERRVPLVAEFWPYGMKRAASFPHFCAAVAGYRGFVDLGAGDAGALRAIAELPALFAQLDASDSFTDVVLV